MISFITRGSFDKTERFLKRMREQEIFAQLEQQAQMGVVALANATPVRTGLTANSWSYQVTKGRGYYKIEWTNSHIVKGANIAILLQYGHGTGTGGYVQGRDYINPAMRNVFDTIAEKAWRVVTQA